ncbi:MAG: MlaD family protein [Candidatus Cryptobacteroides sp.]
MMKYSKELKIGIFVIAILVISFFVINYLRGKDIFNREVEYISMYDDLEGLVVSAPVYVKGYKAGKVSDIGYDRDKDSFEVTCSISKEFRIPSDSRMTIYSVDIMGGKGIRIDLGTSGELAGDGDFLAPDSAPDLISGLVDNLGPLLGKVNNTIDSLSLTVSSVNKLLSDGNIASINRTLSHLERTMLNLRKVSGVIDGRSAELEEFIMNLARLSESFNGIAQKVDTAMTGVSSVVTKIDSADIEGVVTSFKSLLEKMNDPDGTVGKLLVDGSVYDSVDSLLKDVDSLVNKIQDNPKKYIKFTIF